MIRAIILILIPFLCFSCSGSDGGPEGEAGINAVYIDPSVLDDGDGTMFSPFKYWESVTFSSGTQYLQKRGTVAREQITVDASGTPDNPIIIGAYGTGDKPVILGSELETGWELESGNIYSKLIIPEDGGLGMVAEDSVVLGYFEFDTDIATTFAAAGAGSYSYDPFTGNVYVWCSDDADPDFHSMEVSERYYGCYGMNVSHIIVKDLDIKWTSFHGIKFGDSDYISVEDCDISGIGGAFLNPLYAGNGVEFGNSTTNSSASGCNISDIFDSGVTVQTYDSNQHAANISFSDMEINRCGFAAVEIAVLNNQGTTGSSIADVLISNITTTNSGRGWSGVRYGVEGRGIKVMADNDAGEMSGVVIEECSVSRSVGEGILIYGKTGIVNITRTAVFDNELDGILVASPTESDIYLNLETSLIYNNGLTIGNGVTFNSPPGAGFSILHNTFADNDNIGLCLFQFVGPSEFILKNNIFHAESPDAQNTRALFYSQNILPGGAIDYNNFSEHGGNIIGYNGIAYINLQNYSAASSFDSNSINNNPGLNPDLSIPPGSPCKGRGDSSVNVTTDYIGNPYNDPPSIGAFQ